MDSCSASEESHYFKYPWDFRLMSAGRNYYLAAGFFIGNCETLHFFHSHLKLHTQNPYMLGYKMHFKTSFHFWKNWKLLDETKQGISLRSFSFQVHGK